MDIQKVPSAELMRELVARMVQTESGFSACMSLRDADLHACARTADLAAIDVLTKLYFQAAPARAIGISTT